ncbi:hypothetical protein ABPG75_010206 [Micractinium tetrahymenae]
MSHRDDYMKPVRAAVVALAVFLSFPALAACGRAAAAVAETKIEGLALIVAQDFVNGTSNTIAAIMTKERRRVQLLVRDQSLLEGITTGVAIEATGRWEAAVPTPSTRFVVRRLAVASRRSLRDGDATTTVGRHSMPFVLRPLGGRSGGWQGRQAPFRGGKGQG